MIDIDHHINERRRQVGRRVHEAGEVRSVTITTVLPHRRRRPLGRVHEPGTNPPWFLPVSGDLRVGGHFQLEGNAGGNDRAVRSAARLHRDLGVR